MSKDCGHTVPCGCKDKALVTPPPCDVSDDCAGESCAEVFCEECITHCQDDMEISIGGATFGVDQGYRLNEVLELLLIFLNDDSCTSSTTAYGLKITQKNSTSMTIAWSGDTALTYQVQWDDGVTPLSQLVTGALSYQIINLAADTLYRVNIVEQGSSCLSVTLKVTTKP